MGDVLTMQDVRDAVEQLESTGAYSSWPDGKYRLTVHPESMVGRALRAGISQIEIKRRFGLEVDIDQIEIVSAPVAHTLTASQRCRVPLAPGSYGMGLAGATRAPVSADLAREARAGLRMWRPTGRKAR